MQTRPYPEKDGLRIWLAREEQRALLDLFAEEYPRRQIAFELGLHGLRTDEIIQVQPRHFVRMSGTEDRWKLIIPEGKQNYEMQGKRETPVSNDLRQHVKYLKSASRMRQDERVIDVSKRSIRNWMGEAREDLVDVFGDEDFLMLGMHDLRRTFATDAYYSLAVAGVPIAEQLVMSWGGWTQSEKGRETFRQNYLGPVPDHVAAHAVEHLALV